MATITRQPPLRPKWIPKRLSRLTVDQYEAMVDSDVFTKHDHFVLINGYLVTKLTKKSPHVIAGELIRDELITLVPRNEWRVMVDAPVRMPDYNEPEPDVALARGKAKDYTNRHPGPADLALVAEVSKSSLTEDRGMANIYGPAGIPVYWIVNLKAHQVEVYALLKRRGTPRYGKPRIFKAGQSVPVVVECQEVGRIAVLDILPPPERTSGGSGV